MALGVPVVPDEKRMLVGLAAGTRTGSKADDADADPDSDSASGVGVVVVARKSVHDMSLARRVTAKEPAGDADMTTVVGAPASTRRSYSGIARPGV